MSSLSTILAEIETSAEIVKNLETELTAARQHGKELVDQYRTLSGDALKLLGIGTPRKERKLKTNEEVLLGSANRKIHQMVKGGEKNTKTILTSAIEAAERIGKAKLGLSELAPEIKHQIEGKVRAIGKK